MRVDACQYVLLVRCRYPLQLFAIPVSDSAGGGHVDPRRIGGKPSADAIYIQNMKNPLKQNTCMNRWRLENFVRESVGCTAPRSLTPYAHPKEDRLDASASTIWEQ